LWTATRELRGTKTLLRCAEATGSTYRRPDAAIARPVTTQPAAIIRDRAVLSSHGALRPITNFLNQINLIPPIQSCLQKYFPSRSTQINSISPPSRPPEGRFAIVTNAGRDAVDAAALGARWDGRAGRKACERSRARRRTALMRTAKPCGPGTRCWCQVGGGMSARPGFEHAVNSLTTVTRRIRRRGEHEISR
jgi:hypothetical protein